jgi:hypothetical protein
MNSAFLFKPEVNIPRILFHSTHHIVFPSNEKFHPRRMIQRQLTQTAARTGKRSEARLTLYRITSGR